MTFVSCQPAPHVIFFTKMADLLTTNQVQNLLQVDRTTIYRMVENGRLPAIRVGKQWRFSRADIERWLQMQSVSPSSPAEITAQYSPAQTTPARQPNTGRDLRDLLPRPCVQLIQDAFADILGVMMVTTDMQGNPATQVSNPCGFYAALMQSPDSLAQCVRSWQDLAASTALSPRFVPSEIVLLCARGLIRVESELKGMVVIGGIAPEIWPPSEAELKLLADTFGVSASYVQANVDAVYRLDRPAQDKALRSVQRVADIFSHIVSDQNALCVRLQAIASLTSL